jgi:hypothetical protein
VTAIKFILYFLLGGTIVSLVSYLGSMGRGLLSAFVATFPAITLVTMIFIYRERGLAASYAYAKGLVFFFPAWLAYLMFVVFALPRWGIWKALAGALLLFMTLVVLIRLAMR